MGEPSPPGERAGVFPLATNQVVSWYQPILNPTAPAYYWHLPIGIRIDGALDADALRRCIAALVQRHESTRTTFERSWLGQPRQRVHKSVPVSLECTDLRDRNSSAQQAELADRLRAQLRQPFDWAKAPPWRLSLFRLGITEHLLFMVIHHIIADAWSQAVFFRELSALYAAFSQGQPSPLPPLRAQYADYVQWQEQRIKTGDMEKKFEYWAHCLTPAPGFLEGLPDHPRPAPRSYDAGTETFTISARTLTQVQAVSRSLGITPFSFLLANFCLVLYRRTRQKDLTVTVPAANRTRSVFKDGIGCYARNLPLRVQVAGGLTFAEWARCVHKTARQALARQDVPLYEVMKRLKRRNPAYFEAMYQVVFLFQNAMLRKVERAGLTFTLDLMWEILDISRTDIVCQLFEAADGLEGHLEYGARLFKQSTITGLIETYRRLLAETAHRPERTIEEMIKYGPE